MSSTKNKANPIGRPTVYKPEFCQELLEHSKEGYSFEAFGGRIGVCKDTLYRWLKEYKEFSDARKQARQLARLALEKEGRALTRGEFGRSASATAWIFRMRNICGWRDEAQPEEDDTDEWEIE